LLLCTQLLLNVFDEASILLEVADAMPDMIMQQEMDETNLQSLVDDLI